MFGNQKRVLDIGEKDTDEEDQCASSGQNEQIIHQASEIDNQGRRLIRTQEDLLSPHNCDIGVVACDVGGFVTGDVIAYINERWLKITTPDVINVSADIINVSTDIIHASGYLQQFHAVDSPIHGITYDFSIVCDNNVVIKALCRYDGNEELINAITSGHNYTTKISVAIDRRKMESIKLSHISGPHGIHTKLFADFHNGE